MDGRRPQARQNSRRQTRNDGEVASADSRGWSDTPKGKAVVPGYVARPTTLTRSLRVVRRVPSGSGYTTGSGQDCSRVSSAMGHPTRAE